ncbi:HET-domain-containing protein [Colletotrichum asianum]|uniref:Heterokaryon incompatibility domain-containing protein n=1 Tax=Colletotrichum asianum TaxID=702518 RepID=A0A8H3W8X8_9PEZI|nr:hypothetical protein GQ607_010141 [Colletotrichum asianum]
MGSVYANAYLTICAAQGDSCLDGFLQRPSPSHVIDVPFTSSLDPAFSGTFSIFASSPTIDYVQTDIFKRVNFNDYFNPNPPPPNPYRWTVGSRKPYEEDVNKCGWSGRGWTFQEFLLSPRILLFGKSMVHVCSGNVLIRSEDAMGNSSNEGPKYLLDSRHGITKESEEQVLSDWQRLVRDYSRRSLTHSNDILPAVSALAKLWAGKVEGEYLAGVFSSNLHCELLWAHEGMTTPVEFLNEKLEQYTAPSWSWASQPDRIEWAWHPVTVFKP